MNIESVRPYLDLLSGVANAFTIAASILALYIYFTSHEKISTAFRLLLNLSFQTTLGELKEKLERLNEYNAKEPDHIAEIQSILHEIAGQIKGNSRLLACAPDLPERIERLAGGRAIAPSRHNSEHFGAERIGG